MIGNTIRASLQKVCRALNQQQVEYLIIGGVAVGFYGYERKSTIQDMGTPELSHDLDFWYNPTTANYTRIVKALRELEIDTSSLEEHVFDPQKTYLRIPFTTFRTEFLPQMKGLDSFAACLARAKKITLDGNVLYIIGYADLIQNKKYLDRPIDREDIEQLKKINPGL